MKKVKLYNLSTCEKLIDTYVNKYGGECTTLDEGCLGLGLLLLYGAKGKKTVVIREIAINEWQSMHSIRKYNEMPKKYEHLLNKVEYETV